MKNSGFKNKRRLANTMVLVLCLFFGAAYSADIVKTWYDETSGQSDFNGFSFPESSLPAGMVWKKVTIRQYWVDCVNTTVYLDAVNNRKNNLINDGKGTENFTWTENIPEKFGRTLLNVNGRISHVGWGVNGCYRAAKCSVSVTASYGSVSNNRYVREWWDETLGWSNITHLDFPHNMLPSGKEWKKATVVISEVSSLAAGDIYLKINNKAIDHAGITHKGGTIVFDNIDAVCDISVDGHLSGSAPDMGKAKITVTAEYGDISNTNCVFKIWGDETTGLSNINLEFPGALLPAGHEWRKIRMVVFSKCANGDVYTEQKDGEYDWVFRHDEISPGSYSVTDTNIAGTGKLCITGHISHVPDVCSASSAVAGIAVWLEHGPKRKSLSGSIILCHGLTDVFNSFKHFANYARYRGFTVYGTDVPGCGTLAERAEVLAHYIADTLAQVPDATLLAVGHSMGGLDLRYIVAQAYMSSLNTSISDVYLRAARKLKKVFTIATPHQGNVSGDYYTALFGSLKDTCPAVSDLSDKSTAFRNSTFPYSTFQAPVGRPIPFLAFRFKTDPDGLSNSDCVVNIGSQKWPNAPVYPKIFQGRHCDNYVCQLPHASSCVNELSQVKILEIILTDTVEHLEGDSLAAYWSFNKASGDTAYDFSANGYHGNISGDASRQSGKSGNALYFDGSDDYVKVPYSPLLNPRFFTLSVWAKVQGASNSWRSVITSRYQEKNGKQSGYVIYAGEDNHWRAVIGNGAGWSSAIGDSIINDAWTYIAVTYDGKALKLYINGDLITSKKTTSFMANGKSPLRIGAGRTESNPNFFYKGAIDEVRVFNKALSSDIIHKLYNSGIVSVIGKTGLYSVQENFGVNITSNPFNPNIKIRLNLPDDEKVSVRIYRVSGELVAELFDGKIPQGHHTLLWSAGQAASGLYLYRINYGQNIYTGKIPILR